MTNPVFAMKLIFGPCTAYQYRLRGPNPWKGAKKAIENQWERTEKATMVKDPPRGRETGVGNAWSVHHGRGHSAGGPHPGVLLVEDSPRTQRLCFDYM